MAGAFKYTETQARALEPLIRKSPLVSWMYSAFERRAASAFIGSAEIAIALLVALRALSARFSAVGSLGAMALFATTVSFVFTTPEVVVW